MKRHLLLSLVMLLGMTALNAHPIDAAKAKFIGQKFANANFESNQRNKDLQLVYTGLSNRGEACFYAFNVGDGGFVIVSADDRFRPIVGYSDEGTFATENPSPELMFYLDKIIEARTSRNAVLDERTPEEWQSVMTSGKLLSRNGGRGVDYICTTQWNQDSPYNLYAPEAGSGPGGRCYAGCVATAMSQVMKRWDHPAQGNGSHSYYCYGYGMQSANFGETTYDWEHMPDKLLGATQQEIDAVALFMYHCGVAVEMQFSPTGSGANSWDVPYAIQHYFSYSNHADLKGRDEYSLVNWQNMLKDQFDIGWPVYYSGFSNSGGHAFVCDGYDDNDLLHFNWGWGRANGYFALGSLNPIGYSFNEKNFAILDINPQYEPWTVYATAYPPTLGTVEGNGEYHLGEQCTLTAVPNDNSTFSYWKKGEVIISYNTSYSFAVNGDINDIEAHFSLKTLKEIQAFHAPDTSDVNSPYVNLTWSYDSIHEWSLLKQLEIDGEVRGVTTDGEYLYTNHNRYDDSGEPIAVLRKYTADGDLVDMFELEDAYTLNTTSDGSFIYFGNNHIFSMYLYMTDFTHKTIVDSINMNYRPDYCAYDATNDSFWLKDSSLKKIVLVNRQGEIICSGPTLSNHNSIIGFGSIIAEDGNLHLLMVENRNVKDYNTSDGSITNRYVVQLDYNNHQENSCIGKYDGKDALFVVSHNYNLDKSVIYIFEIDCHFARVKHYHLYRSDSNGNIVTLDDESTGTSFIDSTWNDAPAGMYRFGISEVYFNDTESEIIWSDFIEKTDYGIEEGLDDTMDPSVRKVIEDGHIVIIKDGKRYSITGQQLN